MYKRFYPGAPREIDQAARRIHRLLDREARPTSTAYSPLHSPASRPLQARTAEDGPLDGVGTVVPTADIKPHAQAEDPFALWPSTRPPLARIEPRGSDPHGDGHFGASRGTRRSHMGVDLNASPGSAVYAPIGGTVYVGDPYGNDSARRGQVHSVRIEAPGGQTIRMFYVRPDGGLLPGTMVEPGTYLGVSESLQGLYPGIGDHVHVQVEERSARGR